MPKKFDHTKYRLVKIMWRDAQDFDNGWHDLKKIQAATTEPVQSIGWLVTDKEDRVWCCLLIFAVMVHLAEL